MLLKTAYLQLLPRVMKTQGQMEVPPAPASSARRNSAWKFARWLIL